MLLPQPVSAFDQVDFKEAAVAKDKLFESTTEHYNRDKPQLSLLARGQCVIIQCNKDKKWNKQGTVMEIRPDRLSYLVESD